eukprot:TRINITY_DN906_c0_g1_i1.p1 TRINITY_DN906_c0_g1~~TRINITY_DN906_c0_g1_i1.p1  ORF type:complete len:221 (+),score=44.56 TRINITY_DN906_c0_g1_i1:37-699(+)
MAATSFVALLGLLVIVADANAQQPSRPKIPDNLSSAFVEAYHVGDQPTQLAVGNIYFSRQNQVIRTTVSAFGTQLTTYNDYTRRITVSVLYDAKDCQRQSIPDGEEFPPEDALANATFIGSRYDHVSNQTIYGWNQTRGDETFTVYGDEQGNLVLEEFAEEGSNPFSVHLRYINPADLSPSQPDWFTVPTQCPPLPANRKEKLQAVGRRRGIGLLRRHPF